LSASIPLHLETIMEQNSNAPVDVLAVMGRCASRHDCSGDYGHAEELREARAAVAELIEAAKFARYTAAGQTGYTDGADRRLAAAIAAVGGAS
jgi:hypothetical protein